MLQFLPMAERILFRSLDVDDTLIDRGRTLRVIGLAGSRLRREHYRVVSLDSFPNVNHDPVNIPIRSPLEKLSLALHARRRLLDGVRYALSRTTSNENSRNVVNSGRSNKQEWVEMTIGQFYRAHIDEYIESESIFKQGFAFKPDCVSSTESKVDVIRLLTRDDNDVEHYDDDPRTAIVIADLFPNVKVYLVHHTSTSLIIPRSQLRLYPNLYVVSNIGEGIDRS